MTQDDRWETQYQQIMQYMEETHRAPSRHRIEDHRMLNWIKYNRKLVAKGRLTENRLEKFNLLLETAQKYRRVNQYA